MALKLLQAVLLWTSTGPGVPEHLKELQTLLLGLKTILAAVGGGPSRQCMILMMQTLARAVKLAESGVSRAAWPSSPERTRSSAVGERRQHRKKTFEHSGTVDICVL